MEADDPINSMASAMYGAMLKDLPDIEYRWRKPGTPPGENEEIRTRRPAERDISVCQFPQTWGSTALGFGGVGGQAMTTGDVTIVECHGKQAVYFAGRFAYLIDRPNHQFLEDVRNQQMADVSGAKSKYERKP